MKDRLRPMERERLLAEEVMEGAGMVAGVAN